MSDKLTDEFRSATYFDCRDSERLSHETPEEAIEELIDNACTPGCDVSALIAANGSVEVVAYQRQKVSQQWIAGMADQMVELLVERFSEEFGDPDGSQWDEFDDKLIAQFTLGFAALVASAVSEAQVFQCERVGEVSLDAAEVEALMRAARPDWWET